MNTKKCSKCGIIKNIIEFSKDKKTKDGYRCWCKSCISEYNYNYKIEKKDILKEKRKLNSEAHKEKMKKWHEENKEYEKEYRERTKEHKKTKNDIWYKNTIEERRKWHRNYKRKVRENELIYMQDRVRNMINHSFRRKGYTKKSKTYEVLGAEYDVVLEHLKNTWYKNYGKEYNNEPYHIDHIIPISLATTEEEVIKLCHYTNLQLLKPDENIRKSNKLKE